MSFCFGGRWWIRTTEVIDDRFTVCSLWPLGKPSIFDYQLDWSWWTDLNPRPADYKSAALPTELHQRIVAIVIDYITKPQGVSTRIKQELPHTAMVEVTGLEPAASWSQTKHSTKLSYTSVSNRKAATCFQIFPLIIPHIFLFVKSFLQNTRKNQKPPRSSSKCACKPGAIMVHYKNPV